MRARTPITIAVATLLLGVAGYSEHRLRERDAVAEAVLIEAATASSAYVQTFQGVHLDRQLTHFDERRAVLAQAHAFWLLRNLMLLALGLLAVFAYWQAFLARLEGLRLDVAPESAPVSRPSEPVIARPATALS